MKSGVVYRHFSATGELLYIGSSVNFVARTNQHKDSSRWFSEVSTITVEHYETVDEARNAEIDAIEKESPRENFRHMKNDLLRRPAKKKQIVKSGAHAQLDAISREFCQPRRCLPWYFEGSFDHVNEIISSGRSLTDEEIVSLKRRLFTTFKRLEKIGLTRSVK